MTEKKAESAFQTKTTIRALLDSGGFSPKKRFGQCFLIDRNLMTCLLESAELTSSDCVLEVGVGTGSLTALLAERAGQVVAVEVDPDVASLAAEQFTLLDNVRLIQSDALAGKSELSPALTGAVRAAQSEVVGALKLVANLPYDIATPLVINLLESDLGFERMCFTVQTEVADRFLAESGTHDYGPISILTQLLAVGRRVCKLPPQAFWPAPKVYSSMVRLDLRAEPEVSLAEIRRFSVFIRAFFNHRRKTLGHLAKSIGISDVFLPALSGMGIESNARPENLAPRQWAALFRACG